ncbi:hypothetical protein BofuT4_P020990.1 [Botrytis cinerea T4]|uniref:Uncharacterized protein n=1 Tax=Botryotinia fuckeliana (strain T4) TaxID=999810 RepID=G2YJA6_BOTF4|nr:hypothetical protein BofuT4_P020990.1 [Botrytis cinerea T4]
MQVSFSPPGITQCDHQRKRGSLKKRKRLGLSTNLQDNTVSHGKSYTSFDSRSLTGLCVSKSAVGLGYCGVLSNGGADYTSYDQKQGRNQLIAPPFLESDVKGSIKLLLPP